MRGNVCNVQAALQIVDKHLLVSESKALLRMAALDGVGAYQHEADPTPARLLFQLLQDVASRLVPLLAYHHCTAHYWCHRARKAVNRERVAEIAAICIGQCKVPQYTWRSSSCHACAAV
jgi:hypothetical protein